MATAEVLERQLRVATASLQPEEISALLAKTARTALATAISAGEASPDYVKAVNGRLGAAEETVVAPGPIIYRFIYLEEAALFAVKYAETHSPVLSGRYRKSWFLMVNGAPWNRSAPIPIDAEMILVNDQPYHRKVEVGAMKMSVPPRIVEQTRQAVFARFGSGTAKTVEAEIRFIQLRGGYVLKGRARRGRKDRGAGQPLTYPALILRAA